MSSIAGNPGGVDSSPRCHNCGAPLTSLSGTNIGRGEECEKCRADVRVCLNCRHYDRSAYNECRESMADRVVEKDRRNFCDYFSLGSNAGAADDKKKAALKSLDDLFKK